MRAAFSQGQPLAGVQRESFFFRSCAGLVHDLLVSGSLRLVTASGVGGPTTVLHARWNTERPGELRSDSTNSVSD